MLKPNVMFVVDTSGSMNLPIDPNNSACPSGCGPGANPCPANCPTRISELRSSLTAWLTAHGDFARLALTTYPVGTTCEVPMSPLVALAPATATDEGTTTALQQQAGAVTSALAQVTPVGGTPTSATLEMVASLSGLQANDGREDLVVLLTDGLPNCNANNVNNLCTCGTNCTAAQQTACACTTSSCANTLCAIGCLDSTAAISAVSRLRTAGIKTVVVGFGADLGGGAAPMVLDAMARAGGAPRSCPAGTTAECGGQVCRTDKTCEQAHYTAGNGLALTGVLDAVF